MLLQIKLVAVTSCCCVDLDPIRQFNAQETVEKVKGNIEHLVESQSRAAVQKLALATKVSWPRPSVFGVSGSGKKRLTPLRARRNLQGSGKRGRMPRLCWLTQRG